jgi:rRNA biogenesis protein RRP5
MLPQISKVSDEHLDRLTGNKAYAVGKKHDVRVIGFNPIEGLVSLSMQKSVLEKPFLRLQDIRPGQIVEVRAAPSG